MSSAAPLYISATKQDTGKTTVTIGLVQGMRALGYDVGYMKPVGQRYIQYEGLNIDEDAVLALAAFGLKDHPGDMSPIAIERGFTEHYIFNRDPAPLERRILEAYEHIRQAHEFPIIEGTGHAGVGSCFDLSNARVAELLHAGVVIVTAGGIGRAIDEVALSLHLFRKHGVRVLGVILNKVLPEKHAKVQRAVTEGLRHLGTRLLGAVPYRPELSLPRVEQVVAELHCKWLIGRGGAHNLIRHTVVAAMEPSHMTKYIVDNTLVIIPGDRVDDLFCRHMTHPREHGIGGRIAGIVLTGGFVPAPLLCKSLDDANVPVLLCEEDTYTVATRLRELVFKIQPEDTDKIEAAQDLIRSSVDIPTIIEELRSEGP
jgi:hypothetical protein